MKPVRPPRVHKFEQEDARYKSKRAAFADELGPVPLWTAIDAWPLYVGSGNLARTMVIADLLRETAEVPGDIAEFGIWRGATTMLMAKLVKMWEPQGSRVIHGFDSFEGLTEFSAKDGVAVEHQGAYRGNRDQLEDMMDLYEMDGLVRLHQGYIENTLPLFLEENPAQSFSLMICDTDLYESTRVILESGHERMMPGGLIVFDEWNSEIYPGEGLAANEFLKAHPGEYVARSIRGARQPNMILQKRG